MAAREFHILLVEDNPADARLTAEALTEVRPGTRITHVERGEEALAFLRGRGGETPSETIRPDLILLDLNLPGLDGRDVLAAVKSDPTLCHLPVVVWTSSQAESDVAAVYNLKANCLIRKPSELEALQRAMHCLDRFWIGTALVPAD